MGAVMTSTPIVESTSAVGTSSFWTDHQQDLEDPKYALAFMLEQIRIDTVNRVMDRLDESRAAAKIPKTQLARIIGAGDSAVRRLFAARGGANPTFDTVVKMAATLGFEIELKPMKKDRREAVQYAVSHRPA